MTILSDMYLIDNVFPNPNQCAVEIIDSRQCSYLSYPSIKILSDQCLRNKKFNMFLRQIIRAQRFSVHIQTV